MLIIVLFTVSAKCRYAERRHVECRGAIDLIPPKNNFTNFYFIFFVILNNQKIIHHSFTSNLQTFTKMFVIITMLDLYKHFFSKTC
jgi:hypothetical protein